MSAVTTEKSKTAGAVVDEPVVPVQAGPVDEQAATAEAIAAALDPALVSRLAAQARAQRYTARAMADRYLACYEALAPHFADREELACA